MRTCRSDAKGKGTNGLNREAESTDAEHRGGLPRSSDEGSVMELELRGCVVLLLHKNNSKGEDSVGKSKVV